NPRPCSQSRRTAAPAESPKSTQVLRSFQLTNFDRTSAPTTSTVFASPPAMYPCATAAAYTQLLQAADTSKAPAWRAPKRACQMQAVAGENRAGVAGRE